MTRLRGVTRSSLVRYSAGLLAIASALLLLWPGLSSNLFALGSGAEMFMPHGHCYLWVPSLVALHVSADLLIGISYTAISMTLAYLVYRARREMPFHWIFLAFGLFIVACGATHFMEVWTLWNATYWLSGYVKLITATASLATAVVLPAIVPKTLLLVSDAKASEARKRELETINQELEKQIVERKQTEQQLRQATQTLHAIFKAAPLAIYAVDSEGKVLMWNPAAERIFGWSEQEALGRLLPLVPEDRRGEFDSVRERALQGQSFADMEVQRRKNDGSVIEASISTAPLRNAEGDIVGVLGITADITERKRVEEELQRSEEKYRDIFNNATMGIYQSAADGTLITANATLARMLDYASPQDLLGLNVAKDIYYSTQDREASIATPEPAGSAMNIEVRWKSRGGAPIWVHLNAHAIQDEHGKTLYFDGFVQDITERKLAQEAVRESEERYRELVENANDIIYTHDLTGRFISMNKAGERISGYTREEFLRMNIADIIAPEYVEQARQRLAAKVAGGALTVYELEVIAKDGSRVALEVNSRLRLDGTVAVGIQGIARDVTDRKHAEEAVRASDTERRRAEAELDAERRLISTLFEQIPVGVLLRKLSGPYTHANRAVANILGIPEQKLIGMGADELYTQVNAVNLVGTPLDVQDIPSTVALRNKRATGPLEVQITTHAGEKRRLTIASAPLENHEGNLLGSVTVMTDVTELSILEEQLRQSQKMDSIGTLAGGVAHDFNNLLTAILGHTQLAMRSLAPDEPSQSHLIEVEKAGNRATALTRQLLAFSRRQRLERKTLDLNNTIRDIVKMIRRIIGEDIDVSVKESIDVHPVFADPAQVEQVIMNLAVNARDAMLDGGQLVIDTRNATLDEEYCREHPYAKPGKYALMTVSDTGTGMDSETKMRIFEPFFTTKEPGKGTGLGLAMVFGIVKQHDGLIEVYSELGHGTSFKIYLPVDKKAIKEEPQEVLAPLRGGKETILVAEDEEALRGLARTILEELGYRVLLASDGAEAIEVYQANRESVSLLVFDIVMPRMSGREAYERILEMGGDVPALFMTGYSAEIVQNQFLAQNQFLERTGSVLLQKPYSLETFGRKVREVLDQEEQLKPRKHGPGTLEE